MVILKVKAEQWTDKSNSKFINPKIGFKNSQYTYTVVWFSIQKLWFAMHICDFLSKILAEKIILKILTKSFDRK